MPAPTLRWRAPGQATHTPIALTHNTKGDRKVRNEPSERNDGNSFPDMPESGIIAYNLREGERPSGVLVRWKWRIETGRKAEALDARQAEVIRRILQWQYDRKHNPPV
jgi:hypothetical protein